MIYRLNNGDILEGIRVLDGEVVGGDSRWLEFSYRDRTLYAHITVVDPLAERQLGVETTVTPTRKSAPPTDIYIIYHEGGSVNLRACPQTSCSVTQRFANWQEIDVIGKVEGQNISGNDQWFEVWESNQRVYLHSSLASPLLLPLTMDYNWYWNEDKDEFTEDVAVFFWTTAIEFETGDRLSSLDDDPVLIIRCGFDRDDHDMEILINWDDLIFSSNIWNNLLDGRVRWDDDEAIEQNWYESTTNKSTFMPNYDKGRFLRHLFTREELRVIVENNRERFYAKFRISGLLPLIYDYTEICGLS